MSSRLFALLGGCMLLLGATSNAAATIYVDIPGLTRAECRAMRGVYKAPANVCTVRKRNDRKTDGKRSRLIGGDYGQAK